LALLLGIEGKMGRRRMLRWGPRIIDLDILLFSDLMISEEDLIIPHPRFHQRRFVLEPLCEIDPDCIHPGLGKSMTDLLSGFRDEMAVIKIKPSVAKMSV
jgi:2-amino-4-hydroxy-6-hydroxymethyldihydropteridine diphosphokinase